MIAPLEKLPSIQQLLSYMVEAQNAHQDWRRQSWEEFQDLMNKQKGCCAICERDFGSLDTRAHIDHNHSTGKIRALLCNKCNTMIGHVENMDVNSVLIYLSRPITSTKYTAGNAMKHMVNTNSKVCEICGAQEDLVVDHDYSSGLVRGTLCQSCNIHIVAFESDQYPKYVEYLHLSECKQ